MTVEALDHLARLEESLSKELGDAIDLAIGDPPQPDRIRDILVQRRLLSVHSFTWMMDNLICAMEGDAPREIAIGILRDEYSGANHRFEFLKEIEGLGYTRHDILRCPPSRATGRVIKQIIRYTLALTRGSELQRVVFLRYFAEVLPGEEFAQIFDLARGIGLLTAERSRFLWPHIMYDVFGSDKPAHADQYVQAIAEEMRVDEDEEVAADVLRRAALIRKTFYSQFVDT